jgi:hypothetical protein
MNQPAQESGKLQQPLRCSPQETSGSRYCIPLREQHCQAKSFKKARGCHIKGDGTSFSM